MIDDESLVKTLTNTCLSETSGIPSYSVPGCLLCFWKLLLPKMVSVVRVM